MKKVIRYSVWETNSSTQHTCVIMTEEQNKKWKEENLYYYGGGYWNHFKELPKDKQPKAGGFYTQDEVLEFYKLIGYEPDPEIYAPDEDDEEDNVYDVFISEMDDFITYENWSRSEYLEYDDNYYTTPGGEKIVVECKYGYDG